MLYTNEAIKKRKKTTSFIRTCINIIIYIIFLPMLVYNIILIAQAIANPDKTPNFFGIKNYIIISGSMEPQIQVGDLAVVKEVKSQEELSQGDIISFDQGESVITHRISKIINDDGTTKYQTKGDNNNAEDSELVNFDAIEGKVIKILPKLGKIAMILQNKFVIICVIILVYIYMVYDNSTRNKKRKRRIKRLEYEKAEVQDEQ